MSGPVASRRRSDRGTVTVFVVVFAPVVFMMMGLVYEGGRNLAAQREANRCAAAAARAGAQAIDEDHIRGGGSFNILNEGDARARVRTYMDQIASGSCRDAVTSFNGASTEVTVTVRVDTPVRILPGLSRTVTGEGTACAEFGISGSMSLCDT